MRRDMDRNHGGEVCVCVREMGGEGGGVSRRTEAGAAVPTGQVVVVVVEEESLAYMTSHPVSAFYQSTPAY